MHMNTFSFHPHWFRHLVSLASLFFVYIAIPLHVYAAGLVPCDGLDCNFNTLVTLAQYIINFFAVTVPFVAALFFAYGAFLYITAAGDKGKISKAHKIFTNAAIGLVLTLAAWLVIFTILKGLGVTDDAFWFLAH